MYNNCQLEENKMFEIAKANKVLLVQIGENFTGEGILSVLIEEEALKEMKFEMNFLQGSEHTFEGIDFSK